MGTQGVQPGLLQLLVWWWWWWCGAVQRVVGGEEAGYTRPHRQRSLAQAPRLLPAPPNPQCQCQGVRPTPGPRGGRARARPGGGRGLERAMRQPHARLGATLLLLVVALVPVLASNVAGRGEGWGRRGPSRRQAQRVPLATGRALLQHGSSGTPRRVLRQAAPPPELPAIELGGALAPPVLQDTPASVAGCPGDAVVQLRLLQVLGVAAEQADAKFSVQCHDSLGASRRGRGRGARGSGRSHAHVGRASTQAPSPAPTLLAGWLGDAHSHTHALTLCPPPLPPARSLAPGFTYAAVTLNTSTAYARGPAEARFALQADVGRVGCGASLSCRVVASWGGNASAGEPGAATANIAVLFDWGADTRCWFSYNDFACELTGGALGGGGRARVAGARVALDPRPPAVASRARTLNPPARPRTLPLPAHNMDQGNPASLWTCRDQSNGQYLLQCPGCAPGGDPQGTTSSATNPWFGSANVMMVTIATVICAVALLAVRGLNMGRGGSGPTGQAASQPLRSRAQSSAPPKPSALRPVPPLPHDRL